MFERFIGVIMKTGFVLMAMFILALLASLSVDGKNCKKAYRCIPTATPTTASCSAAAGSLIPATCVRTAYYQGQLLCQYIGTATWFPCRVVVYGGKVTGYLPGGYYTGGYQG